MVECQVDLAKKKNILGFLIDQIMQRFIMQMETCVAKFKILGKMAIYFHLHSHRLNILIYQVLFWIMKIILMIVVFMTYMLLILKQANC